MYCDRPKPSRTFVGFLIGTILLLLGQAAWMTAGSQGQLQSGQPAALWVLFGVVWLAVLATCAFLGWLMRGAYRIEYIVSGGAVELRCGRLFHETIPAANIVGIQRVRRIPLVLGRGFRARGCCNRMSNGLLLTTTTGRVYVSPSDIGRFCEELGIKAAE